MFSDEDYFESQEFLGKVAEYEQCLSEGLTPFIEPDLLTDIADYYNNSKHPEEAQKAIELALEMYPGSVMPLIFKAREAMQNNDLDKSEEYVSMIYDQDDPDVLYINSEIMILRGRIEDTGRYMLDNYHEMVGEEKDSYAMDCATIWYDNQYYDKAYAWMKKIESKEYPDAKELKGRILFGMQKYDESCDVFEELIDKDPFSQRIWQLLACAQYMSDKCDEALKSTGFALAIDPDYTDSLSLKAAILLKKDDYEQAAEYFLRYIKLEPEDMMTYADLATCYNNMEQYGMAREMAHKAFQSHDPEVQLRACEELVLIETACGNMPLAKVWGRLSGKFTDDPAEPLVLEGHVLMCMKKPGEAMTLFKNAMACSSNPNAVKIRMIASLLDNGYKRLGLWAVRYYCDCMRDITYKQLENMTPDTLIKFIYEKQQQ